ncbi:LLM class flavin-dependent oxidoreductase [Streptomyces roseolilacinus]|uniref:N5,N10-methylene tetrahydromethanopterin reductase n=1 Tax=Streptomyces roseolilacinus TaxID=66904 RepID=A0A918B121_9ACTN|nr:LLM class flavin-dependent oxidoreductase [Streptomyces roseolilacinus]GGQ09555.1 N5,N10-methylene tetrahydromethanopterin reductase [Streptomyces roseolilacinus]
MSRIGVMFDRDRRPEELRDFAHEAESLGVDDLWVVEDLAWAGSVSSATLALTATDRLRVGIGIMPAPLRNPALLAMELATLARVFPDRLVVGVGHGVPEWMAQVGAATPTKLALLEETVTAVRTLLRGETAHVDGRAVHIDGVRLVHPPAEPPPVVTGVVRPRSLELSGRCADGTVMAEGQGPAAVRTALAHIAAGRTSSPAAPTSHQLIVFTHLCVSRDDPDRVATATAPVRAEYSDWLGIAPEDVFLASGTPQAAAARIRSLWDAGADTVVLRPVGDDPWEQVRAALAALGR